MGSASRREALIRDCSAQLKLAERRLKRKAPGDAGLDDRVWNRSTEYLRRYILEERAQLLQNLQCVEDLSFIKNNGPYARRGLGAGGHFCAVATAHAQTKFLPAICAGGKASGRAQQRQDELDRKMKALEKQNPSPLQVLRQSQHRVALLEEEQLDTLLGVRSSSYCPPPHTSKKLIPAIGPRCTNLNEVYEHIDASEWERGLNTPSQVYSLLGARYVPPPGSDDYILRGQVLAQKTGLLPGLSREEQNPELPYEDEDEVDHIQPCGSIYSRARSMFSGSQSKAVGTSYVGLHLGPKERAANALASVFGESNPAHSEIHPSAHSDAGFELEGDPEEKRGTEAVVMFQEPRSDGRHDRYYPANLDAVVSMIRYEPPAKPKQLAVEHEMKLRSFRSRKGLHPLYLMDAMESGHIDAVKTLVDFGILPCVPWEVVGDRRSCFMEYFVRVLASSVEKRMKGVRFSSKHTQIIRLLLPYVGDLNSSRNRDSAGRQFFLIHHAADWGSRVHLSLLLENGANVNIKSGLSKETPLHVVARKHGRQHLRLAAALIEHGAALDAVDGKGMSALHHAAEANSPLMCKLLLAAGSQKKKEDPEGRTAARVAESLGHAQALGVIASFPVHTEVMDQLLLSQARMV
jgi:hypothetical protein